MVSGFKRATRVQKKKRTATSTTIVAQQSDTTFVSECGPVSACMFGERGRGGWSVVGGGVGGEKPPNSLTTETDVPISGEQFVHIARVQHS